MTLGILSGMFAVGNFQEMRSLVKGISLDIVPCVVLGVVSLVKGAMTFGVLFGVVFGAMSGRIWESVMSGIVYGGVSTAVRNLIALRPDSWLWGTVFDLLPFASQSLAYPPNTPLSLPHLTSRLHRWLRQDWTLGIENINEILTYSFQLTPAINALNRALAEIPPEQIIFRVSQVARAPQTWDLLKFASLSWRATLAEKFTLSWVQTLLFFLRQDKLRRWFEGYALPFETDVALAIPEKAAQAAEHRDYYLGHMGNEFKAQVRHNLSERAANAVIVWYFSHIREQWFNAHFRFNTPARATAAGFWYLHAGYPKQAKEAFEVVRSLLYGDEMYELALTLAIFTSLPVEEDIVALDAIAALKISPLPPEPQLRPTSWQAIQHLYNAAEEIKIVQQGLSRNSRSLAFNRALGGLNTLLNAVDTLPEAERNLIQDIAERWKDSLLKVAGEIGNIQITEPVRNPYVVGDPVEGTLFVGREDILRELEELWLRSNHRPSVVLYGHRRMGKTSILRYLADRTDVDFRVFNVTLQGLGSVSRGTGEVLIAIADKIAATLKITPPNDTELLTLPERTFERFLQRVLAERQNEALVVALDEFETLENLIEAGKIPPDFLAYLRSLVQMDARLAFAFAGLHTLQEMTADYFQPFFASVVPIRVSFLGIAATRQLLANPDEDFPLDYTREACDRVHALTGGQPFLVQLCGFQLVRRYNRRVFEEGRKQEGRKQEGVFGVEDVESAIDNEFFQRGRYYFEGVWGQAAQGAAGQQAILRVLAPHSEGLSEAELKANLELDKFNEIWSNWEETLATLKRHDVIAERAGQWRIAVELFRRWCLR